MLNSVSEKTLLFSILFVLYDSVNSGFSWSPPLDYREITSGLPQFDPRQPTDLLAAVGQTVLLPCTVYNLGDKTVAWIRNRDLNILTHGAITFTADPRFDIRNNLEGETWALSIKHARINDTGRYECQVNTDPKMSMFFNLKVQEHIPPKISAFIPGPREQFVPVGSTVSFTCTASVESFQDRPINKINNMSVTWLHNGLPVSFQAERGGISVETDHSESESCSRLTVASVTSEDAGKYTCSSGDARDTVVLIVIQDNENDHSNYVNGIEAMQRDQAANIGMRHSSLIPGIMVLLIPLCFYQDFLL